MKQKLKALASLCLALALTLCLTLPAWAAGDGDAAGQRITQDAKGSITVSEVESGVKVHVYQLMTVNVNNTAHQPQMPVYSWVKPVGDWLKGNANETYKGYISSGEKDYSVTENFKDNGETNAADIAAFYDSLAAAIRNKTITGLTTKEVEAEGTPGQTVSCTISDLSMGNYLVLIEGGMKIYRPSAVNLVPEWKPGEGDTGEWVVSKAIVDLKSSELTITKTVTDTADEETTEREYAQVDIGDTVTYTLVADVPQFPADAINKGYQISDILPDGMTLDEDSITVRGYTGDDDTAGDVIAKKENDAGAYTLTVTDTTAESPVTATRPNDADNPVTFNLNFDYDELHDNGNPQQPYTKLIVTYTATANAEIDVVDKSSNTTGNQNTAYLDYHNNPYEAANATWQTASDTADVYTYGIKVTKTDDNADNPTPLPGAEFTLTKNGGTTPIHFVYTGAENTTQGTYRVATPTEIGETGKTTTTLTVGESGNNMGKLSIYGLDVGSYILKETKAPAGYNLLSQPKEFTITDDVNNTAEENALNKNTPDGIIDNEKDGDNNSTGYISFEVINTQGFTLPTTGGMGTVLFTAGGVVLMGAGLVLLVVFLRRRRAK